jgi:vanillate O-demethylase ferredoxin subunit
MKHASPQFFRKWNGLFQEQQYMNSTLRRWLLPVHRWSGMTVGLVIVLMAVTGASIAFRPQLEPLLNRDLLTVPACISRAPLDTLTASAVAARPAATLDYIRLIAGGDGDARIPAAMVRFTDQRFVYLDPCSGAVLGQRDRWGGLLGTLEQIHRFRFMPNGDLVAGTSALLFAVVLTGGGLFLWLPASWRGVRRALRFNRRLEGPARTVSLHKTVGLYASVIVLASALTGLPQAFDWSKRALYSLTGSAPPAKAAASVPAGGAPRMPLEQLWQRAQVLVPHPQEALIHYPARPNAAVEMYLIAPNAPHINARTLLDLDAYSGAVLRFAPYATSSLGHRLYFWTLSLHTGHVGGPAGQLLLMFGALCIPVLAYSGIGGYLRRRRRRRASGRLTLKVSQKTVEADGICAFDLVDPQGRALPPFSAGAHLDVFLRDGRTRQYSLCNDPLETGRYQICVQRDAHSRGGSRTMHDDVKAGQLLEVSLPKARFALASGCRRSLLIAGGIGITPLISMADHLARCGADFELHYCTRTARRTAFRDRIARAPYAARAHFHFSDGPAEQLVDFTKLLAAPCPGNHLYVCGPPGFLNVVRATARQSGWPDSHVHTEYFSAESTRKADDAPFDLRLARSGKVLHVASDKTALEVLSAAGIEVQRSCEKGVCGTCVTRVMQGVPDHRDLYLTDAERGKNDQFTPCCSRALGAELVLDL